MTLLVIYEILGLFVNTLNAEVWDFLRYSENLQQSIQMQLSNKSKIFSEIFTPFLKFTSNFKHFEKKDDPHSLFISGITDCETRGYENV